ncbi:MFS transporter [Streptomyces sp. NPDC048106]|uniref:MFS transporter n=1 Tax=Streptomyces sp. NPDC048106 TaxID=3155750 RepID=UPI00345487EE
MVVAEAKDTGTSAGLLRDRDFLLFAGGQGASALGDSLSKTALPLLVLALTGSAMHMGVIAMLSTLPMLVLGVPAGAWADRFDRRRMMLWSDIGRTVLVALVPLAAVLGLPVLPVLYAISVPVGVLFVVFEAACLSCVPALVGRERLAGANSLLSVGNALGYLIGPSLGGLLVAGVGGAVTIGVDAATFAVSAFTLLFIRRPLQAPDPSGPSPMGRQIREGLRFIAGRRLLLAVLVYWSAITFCTAPVVICATYFVRTDLGRPPQVIGLIITVYAVGAIVGAALTPRLRRSSTRVMVAGTTIGGVALLVFAVTSSLPLILAAALLAGTGEAVAAIFYTTLRAEITPDELLGRVTTTAQVATFALRPLSVFVAGIALEATSGAATLATIGALCLVASAVFAFRTRSLDTAPTPSAKAGR